VYIICLGARTCSPESPLQKVALYDPRRRPANWMQIIQPGQYAVFHKDARTEIETNSEGAYLPSGEPSTCLIFDSLEEAKKYCELRVQQFSNLRCEIYDHAGKARLPAAIVLNPALAGSLEESPANSKRKIIMGIALMLLSLPLFFWDWKFNWSLILPTLIGLNLIFFGFRIAFWGIGMLERSKARQ